VKRRSCPSHVKEERKKGGEDRTFIPRKFMLSVLGCFKEKKRGEKEKGKGERGKCSFSGRGKKRENSSVLPLPPLKKRGKNRGEFALAPSWFRKKEKKRERGKNRGEKRRGRKGIRLIRQTKVARKEKGKGEVASRSFFRRDPAAQRKIREKKGKKREKRPSLSRKACGVED